MGLAFETVAGLSEEKLAKAERELAALRAEMPIIEAALNQFIAVHDDPAELELKSLKFLQEFDEIKEREHAAFRAGVDSRAELEHLLRERLAIVREWGLTLAASGSAEEMALAVSESVETAQRLVRGHDVGSLRRERSALQDEIRSLDRVLDEIAEALKHVEEIVVAEALVVATTLTRAYLRDSIWQRRYDTVILDEASMAPIPALWAVASRSDRAAVVVGDFKQLPPIVIAQSEEAERWLGRDVFNVAELDSPECDAAHLVKLQRQYRMHPDVSAIPNELFYDHELTNDESADADDELAGWYRRDWGHDSSVLLVDTGPTNAWVTSVARGQGSSRLNFLSATICVDLAEQVLDPDREPFQPGDPPRVVIICPYRPHARLLELLLREQHISGEVLAGTAHIFQGTEASVVILDLVNDEPHWRVAMFTPDHDESTKRILNVAITRARRRLMVVGDFDYMSKLSKKAFFGNRFLPMLESNYPKVSALDVVPVGLGVRAAKAQSAVSGGAVEAASDRLVVTHEHFYPLLMTDIANAKGQVVIYSPFITQNRVTELQTAFLAAIERGVRVFVVTKTLSDRGQREKATYRQLMTALEEWGVRVVPKQGMHEKLVLVDDEIVWVGSLNPLSYSNTQEIMDRRQNRIVAADYAKTIRLAELVGEYRDGLPRCPICGSQMVASEGRDDPYYWKCLQEDCYTRSIDEAPITDQIMCHNCGGQVEFGKWGERDAWRCVENPRHRQWIARTHLRLPKMQAIVPRRDLTRMMKQWGLTLETSKPDTLFEL